MEGKLDAVLVELRGTMAAHGLRLDGHDDDIAELKGLNAERRGLMRAIHVAYLGVAGILGALATKLFDAFLTVSR